MTNSFLTDPNSIRRKFKIVKYFNQSQEIINKQINKIQDKIDKIDWTEENKIERIRLYQELGKVTEMYRQNRIRIKYYHEDLLEKVNLTG